MATHYVIADGFIVNGKHSGETVTTADVENIDILVESGRVEKQGKHSGTLKAVIDDPSEEM